MSVVSYDVGQIVRAENYQGSAAEPEPEDASAQFSPDRIEAKSPRIIEAQWPTRGHRHGAIGVGAESILENHIRQLSDRCPRRVLRVSPEAPPRPRAALQDQTKRRASFRDLPWR